MTSPLPTTDIDLFSDSALADPFPLYEELPAAGPAVWPRRTINQVLCGLALLEVTEVL